MFNVNAVFLDEEWFILAVHITAASTAALTRPILIIKRFSASPFAELKIRLETISVGNSHHNRKKQ